MLSYIAKNAPLQARNSYPIVYYMVRYLNETFRY